MPLTEQSARPTIDAHHQKHLNSCSGSLAEILLKLSNEVPPDFYELQSKEANGSTGLANIKDQKFGNATIRTMPKGMSDEERVAFIRQELAEGRSVGLYLVFPTNKPNELRCHGYAVVDENANGFVALAKFSEQGNGEGAITTEPLTLRLSDIGVLEHIEAIYLEH